MDEKKPDRTEQREVIEKLNEPLLEIDGVEELEERLEMVCGRDCCRYSSYGRC